MSKTELFKALEQLIDCFEPTDPPTIEVQQVTSLDPYPVFFGTVNSETADALANAIKVLYDDEDDLDYSDDSDLEALDDSSVEG